MSQLTLTAVHRVPGGQHRDDGGQRGAAQDDRAGREHGAGQTGDRLHRGGGRHPVPHQVQ